MDAMLEQGENESYLSAFELKPTRAFDFLNAKDLKVSTKKERKVLSTKLKAEN